MPENWGAAHEAPTTASNTNTQNIYDINQNTLLLLDCFALLQDSCRYCHIRVYLSADHLESKAVLVFSIKFNLVFILVVVFLNYSVNLYIRKTHFCLFQAIYGSNYNRLTSISLFTNYMHTNNNRLPSLCFCEN